MLTAQVIQAQAVFHGLLTVVERSVCAILYELLFSVYSEVFVEAETCVYDSVFSAFPVHGAEPRIQVDPQNYLPYTVRFILCPIDGVLAGAALSAAFFLLHQGGGAYHLREKVSGNSAERLYHPPDLCLTKGAERMIFCSLFQETERCPGYSCSVGTEVPTERIYQKADSAENCVV